jgi:hypothetical protein
MGRRFNRPRVRQLLTRRRRGEYVYAVGSCACGWAEFVGGTYGIALRVAGAHWATHARPPWRLAPPLRSRAAGRG